MVPARPSGQPPPIQEDAIRADGRADSPTASSLATPVTAVLALAPTVDGLLEPFVFRTLALLNEHNPLPWSAPVHNPVRPRPDLVPDHSTVLGMESDLLHLLDALRQSPDCALLDGGREDGPLPARMEPRWLARPRDLEYIPSPRTRAPFVPWRPAVCAAHLAPAVENIPAASRNWPEREVELLQTRETGHEPVAALSPRAERLFRLWVRPDRRPAPRWNATGNAAAAVPAGSPPANVRLPVELRGFHENGILARPHVIRHLHKASAPGWMVSLLTALVIILLSTWFLEKPALDRFTLTHAEASAPSDAAQTAFPTMSKYVEVTGVRASVDAKTSEIRYVVVNHSAAELPPFLLAVKLHPKRGNAVVCSFTATVPGMGPNESLEMKTTIPRELHGYDLPEWRDLRVETHVTAKQ